MTTKKLGAYFKTPVEVLKDVCEKYLEYVQEALLFDSSQGDIADFPVWAEGQYGIPPAEAEEYLNNYLEGDGGTLAARA